MPALLLCACGNSLSGEWETRRDVVCSRDGVMNIEDDLEGVAYLPMDCLATCRVDVSFEDLGGDVFDLTASIKTPDVCLVQDGTNREHYECKLDGEELDCDAFFEWKFEDECSGDTCGKPDPPAPNVVCSDYGLADCPAGVCTSSLHSVQCIGGVCTCFAGPSTGAGCCVEEMSSDYPKPCETSVLCDNVCGGYCE